MSTRDEHMDEARAVRNFKKGFSMYLKADLRAKRIPKGWEIYIVGLEEPIGKVGNDGVPRLF